MRRRVAFVVQRCGREVNGGAEALCLAVARELNARWDLEIVTTCARDYMTWADYYKPGLDDVDGVAVRRFPVSSQRDVRRFDRLSRTVRDAGSALSPDDGERWMRAQGRIRRHCSRICVLTVPSTMQSFSSRISTEPRTSGSRSSQSARCSCRSRTTRWPMRMPIWDAFFRLPRAFVFSTPEEQRFLRGRFPPAPLEGPIAGAGITLPDGVDAERFRRRFGITAPFLLYVGRIDASKGCEQLLADFQRYKAVHDDDLSLVFVGQEIMPVPEQAHVRSLGFVDEQSKFDAIAACEMLVMPSELESLSLVLLEAWALGRPTLSNAASPVLIGQSRRSNAGLWYAGTGEFIAAVSVLREPGVANELGQCGRRFIAETCTWERVAGVYEGVIAGWASAPAEGEIR